MTPEIAEKIGMAFGTFIGAGKKLAVGRRKKWYVCRATIGEHESPYE